MKSVDVHVDGLTIRATLRLPPETHGRPPVVVRGPGWMSLASATHYEQYDSALIDIGLAVLAIDYRGLGASDPVDSPGRPSEMAADILAAVARTASIDEVDGTRVGVFGTGGLGASAAIVAASVDRRVRAVAAMSPVATGSRWLRDLRTPEQWRAFISGHETERSEAAGSASPRARVAPIGGILLPPEVRTQVGFKADIAGRTPTSVARSVIDDIMMFSATSAAELLGSRALLLVSPETDVVVPSEHSRSLFEAARDPKRWVVLSDTTSYEAHTSHGADICGHLAGFFGGHLLRSRDRVID